MSDAYEDDLAAERAVFDRIEAANAQAGDVAPPIINGGRPHKVEPIKLVAWRQAHKASIAETAKRWRVSPATVKRLSREYGHAAEAERVRWQCEQLDRELRRHEHDLLTMYLGQRAKALSWVEFGWFGRIERAKGTPLQAEIIAARDAALDDAEREFREGWERSMGPVPGYAARDHR